MGFGLIRGNQILSVFRGFEVERQWSKANDGILSRIPACDVLQNVLNSNGAIYDHS